MGKGEACFYLFERGKWRFYIDAISFQDAKHYMGISVVHGDKYKYVGKTNLPADLQLARLSVVNPKDKTVMVKKQSWRRLIQEESKKEGKR